MKYSSLRLRYLGLRNLRISMRGKKEISIPKWVFCMVWPQRTRQQSQIHCLISRLTLFDFGVCAVVRVKWHCERFVLAGQAWDDISEDCKDFVPPGSMLRLFLPPWCQCDQSDVLLTSILVASGQISRGLVYGVASHAPPTSPLLLFACFRCQLLDRDVSHRPTAREISQHRWLAEAEGAARNAGGGGSKTHGQVVLALERVVRQMIGNHT